MDMAEQFKEEKMKQGFMLATLVSTVAGTFITGINLYDRVNEKRRQRKLDKGQNKKIKDLEKRLNDAQNGNQGGGNSNNNSQDKKDDGDQGNDQRQPQPRNIGNDLRDSLEYGGPTVQREFDHHYAHMGPRFAKGDLLAQTQLQGQVITLQGSVIKLLEEALFSGNPIDINKLYNASEFAREGSIRALRDQYQRLQQALPVQRRPIGPVRRISSTPTLRAAAAPSSTTGTTSTDSMASTSSISSDLGWSSSARTSTGRPPQTKALALAFHKGGPLFCPYAEDLQRARRPTDVNPDPCPACGAMLGITTEAGHRSWKIDKEVVVRERRISRGGPSHHPGAPDEFVKRFEDRTYLLTTRFLVKCHREGAGYACYLCFKHRERDTLCKGVESLVGHVSDKHSIREYESDPDIRDVTRPAQYLLEN
ncbi:hypothetical protein B0T17DRAFT_512602 [Bombardia bombarda]|uniref:Uncharacterized protein n=1 Tax=Bombardia bombarda TaxID=252184 RepID=A0AA39TLH9_9PEZI|nr:hypothetical protein B0T17DRAFT_512602 [Bombardia bombarda]